MKGHLRSFHKVIFWLSDYQTYIGQHIDGLFEFSGRVNSFRYIIIKLLIVFIFLIFCMLCTQVLKKSFKVAGPDCNSRPSITHLRK